MQKRAGPRTLRLLRRFHRTLGLTAALFLLVLAATGVALNHVDALELDRRFVSTAWLLDWYGISVPELGSSFVVGERSATLLGNRIYLDDLEVLRGVDSLAGAVVFGTETVIASTGTFYFISPNGELVDRIDVDAGEHGRIRRIAVDSQHIVVEARGLYALDVERGELIALAGGSAPAVWTMANEVSPALEARLLARYRGEGLSVERLLADLHSGRLLRLPGRLVMDLAALAIVLLALSGIYVWWRC
jgi:hypothetical protein